jgi:ResB-like family
VLGASSSAAPLLAAGGAAVVRVDKFSIDYREDGSERQFYSDLTVLDGTTGRPLSTQHISVNKPLRWGEQRTTAGRSCIEALLLLLLSSATA